MLSEKIQKTINDQINAELYSAYLYASMAAYFESIGLRGFAQWMKVQVQEEVFHATKFFNYVNDRNSKVILKAIDAPPSEWKSPLAAFEEALIHEQKVTSLINNLVELAVSEKDHATNNHLQWFVAEQVEEESNVSTVIDKLKLIGEGGSGLFIVDQELGQRVYVPPAGPAAE